MYRVIWTTFIVAICLVGCQQERAETPAEAIQAIIELHQARDFDSLVRTRYAEISKAEKPEQIQSLIGRFDSIYQDNAKLTAAIAVFRAALEVEPILSDEGTIATFRLDGGFIKLSRMPGGSWGFHL